jgi:hypothetical protein
MMPMGIVPVNNGLAMQHPGGNILNNPRAASINNFFNTININERQESKKVMVRNIAEEIPDLLIESLLKVNLIQFPPPIIMTIIFSQKLFFPKKSKFVPIPSTKFFNQNPNRNAGLS